MNGFYPQGFGEVSYMYFPFSLFLLKLKTTMKLAVIGSRSFDNYTLLCGVLAPYLPSITVIISGAAKGADSLAKRWALEHQKPLTEIIPDWKQYGRAAGPKRNTLIVDQADAVIAFWDNSSKGTQHVINYCLKQNKKLIVVNTQHDKH